MNRVSVKRAHLTPVKTGNEATDRFQTETADRVNDVLSRPMVGARTLEVELSPGPAAIEHGLGRPPRGFVSCPHARTAEPARDDRVERPHTDRYLHVWVPGSTTATHTVVVW